MAEETAQSSEEAPKKKGIFKKILLALVVLILLGGAGSGIYFWRTAVAAENARKAEQKKAERLAADPEGGEEDVAKVIELTPFIVNLTDTEQARYLRMSVSLGVGEGAGEKPDAVFTTKVRNAMLAVLSDKASADVLSPDGKAKLRKELLDAAKKAASEPEVKAVYITDFIVQL